MTSNRLSVGVGVEPGNANGWMWHKCYGPSWHLCVGIYYFTGWSLLATTRDHVKLETGLFLDVLSII